MPASAGAGRAEARQVPTTEQEFRAFSYIVSHDLAASIRHLSEFSRLLIGELGDELSDRQKRHGDHIRAASDHCSEMLERLRLFSLVQQRPLTRIRQDAMAVFGLPLSRLSAKAGAVQGEIALEPLGEFEGDCEWLALAFAELLDNALKFRRPGVAPRIFVRPAHDQAFWRMRISDNGFGVEPRYREAAFGMFRRLNGAAYPGVGAGLAICRRIARLHGGDANFLDCEQGACVELSIPHAVRAVKSARSRKEIENAGAHETAHR
jgi:signal transduction histidine kinase